MAFDTALLAKNITELTPQELASVQSYLSDLNASVTARQNELKKTLEAECFGKIAVAAKDAMLAMSFAKMPKLLLTPTADGTAYEVSYVAEQVKSGTKKQTGTTGKRATQDVMSGDITVNKIAQAMGGIAMFSFAGNQYEGIKELIKALKQPVTVPDPADATKTITTNTGASEADRCWDISKKGISASDIVTKYHADEVSLIFNDKSEMTVKAAVEKMKAARTAAQA